MKVLRAIFALLPAILLIVLFVIAVRSFWFREGIIYARNVGRSWRTLFVDYEMGNISVGTKAGVYTSDPEDSNSSVNCSSQYTDRNTAESSLEFFPHWHGFGLRNEKAQLRSTSVDVCLELLLPIWFVALFPGVIVVFQMRKLVILLRQERIGHCATCGYDLRASPDRCPECGTRVHS